MIRDDGGLNPRINGAFSGITWQVFAQFFHIHPGRKAAVGGVILRQGTQFPDLLEQGGNRLGEVVECNGFFCFVHCLLGLSETMASCFVATEKETRFPLWKSGRKVGIIKWVDLESNWSPVSFLLRHILHLFHSHKLQIQVMNKRPDLLVDLRGEVLRHGGESSIGPGIGRAVPADEPVGNVDVSLVVLRLPVFDQKVAYRVGESLQLGELLHPCAVSVNIRECSYRAALQDIKPGVNLGLTAGGQPYELGNEAGTDDGGLFAFDQGNRHLREKRQQVFAEEALRERPFLWELAGVFEEGMYPGDTAFGVLVLDTVAGLGVVFHYFSGADAALSLAEYVAGSQEAFVALMNPLSFAFGLNNGFLY